MQVQLHAVCVATYSLAANLLLTCRTWPAWGTPLEGPEHPPNLFVRDHAQAARMLELNHSRSRMPERGSLESSVPFFWKYLHRPFSTANASQNLVFYQLLTELSHSKSYHFLPEQLSSQREQNSRNRHCLFHESIAVFTEQAKQSTRNLTGVVNFITTTSPSHHLQVSKSLIAPPDCSTILIIL